MGQDLRSCPYEGTVQHRLFVRLFVIAVLLAMPIQLAYAQRGAQPNVPAAPTPRAADGRVILGALP